MARLTTTLLLLVTLSWSAASVAQEQYWEYTFRPGESIWKIAEKYTTSVDNWLEIRELNKIHEGPDRRIPPGTRIIIPVWMLKIQPVPAEVVAAKGSPTLVRANGDRQEAKVGSLLYSGDRVVTEVAGTAHSLR